jgi:hypothetical protein
MTALETAEATITCTAICPGVRTPLVEAQIDPREAVIRDVLLANQSNKRLATVEEIGALAVFLASDVAASITGTALPVIEAGPPIEGQISTRTGQGSPSPACTCRSELRALASTPPRRWSERSPIWSTSRASAKAGRG